MRALCVALACAALVAAGCGDTLVVAARVVRPATLPLRAFPQVYVLAADDADSGAVADALVQHLAAPLAPQSARLVVRRATFERVTALRATGGIERVSVVILVEVLVDEAQRPDFTSHPLTGCDPGGCYPSTRPYTADIPTLRAVARLSVEDGPSGRVLQETSIEARDEGSEPLAMRARAVLDLAERVGGLVDGGERAVSVTLVEVSDPACERALERLDAGDWAHGAALFGPLVRGAEFARRPRGERAALLFNLGQALRFAGPMDGTALARLDRAAESLRAALRLEPRALYAAGLQDLERQRADLALSAEQRAAAAHNFALSRAAAPPTVPPAPPAYRDAAPDAGTSR